VTRGTASGRGPAKMGSQNQEVTGAKSENTDIASA